MNTDNAHFEREDRYIVIKRKTISQGTENGLRRYLGANGIDTVECVVVEADWPEYETVWRMIETRCGGGKTGCQHPWHSTQIGVGPDRCAKCGMKV